MVGVLAGGDLREQARPRQSLVDDGDRHMLYRHMIVAFLARIFETDVLPDKQACGFVVELLADIFAELDADVATARALPLRIRQRVLDAFAWQLLGQRLATMPLAFGFGGVVRFISYALSSR